MLMRDFLPQFENAFKTDYVGVCVSSSKTGDEIAVTFSLEVIADEYGEYLICIDF